MAKIDLLPNNNPEKYSNADADKGLKVKKVVSGQVKTREPSFLEKAKNTIFVASAKEVENYILNDVILPRVIDLLSDVGHSVIDSIFGTGYRRNYNTSTKNYNSISSNKSYRDDRYSFDESSRLPEYQRQYCQRLEDAEVVLDMMNQYLKEYGAVSVGDFYDLLGISNQDFTWQKYGWYDLRNAKVRYTRDGYLIDMPKAVLLTH